MHYPCILQAVARMPFVGVGYARVLQLLFQREHVESNQWPPEIFDDRSQRKQGKCNPDPIWQHGLSFLVKKIPVSG